MTPAAPEGDLPSRGRSDKGVHTAEAESEARLCVHWHGGSTDKDADTGRGKEAQSRHSVARQEALKTVASRAA